MRSLPAVVRVIDANLGVKSLVKLGLLILAGLSAATENLVPCPD
jgi:hypothetical protein